MVVNQQHSERPSKKHITTPFLIPTNDWVRNYGLIGFNKVIIGEIRLKTTGNDLKDGMKIYKSRLLILNLNDSNSSNNSFFHRCCI
jgi:hypothetical protein